jgi:hypothetical protein
VTAQTSTDVTFGSERSELWRDVMDSVSSIVSALALGASSGLSDATRASVGELYARVKARLVGQASAETVLAEHRAKPETWAEPLSRALRTAGVDGDTEILAFAERVMASVDRTEPNPRIMISRAQGLQFGDNNIQTNTFSDQP